MTTTRPLSNILSGVVGGLIVLVIGAVLIATVTAVAVAERGPGSKNDSSPNI